MVARHLFLTGYRGTGKTSVGCILAEELQIPLIDLDELIQQSAKMTIRELFALGGEGLFRDRESESLQQAVQQTSSVISLGGGAILREQNRRVLAESGVTIWLNATPETVAQRLQSDGATRDQRPALTALPPMDEIRSVMETRRPIYEQVSQFRVDTDGKTTKEIAQEILSFVTTRS